MQANIGNTDRAIRIIGGLGIMTVLFLFLPGNARWFSLLGLIPVVTGLVRWCPLYLPFGFNSCKPQGK